MKQGHPQDRQQAAAYARRLRSLGLPRIDVFIQTRNELARMTARRRTRDILAVGEADARAIVRGECSRAQSLELARMPGRGYCYVE